jgi:hypothetical protein
MARLEFSTSESLEHTGQIGAADTLMALGLMYCTGRDTRVDLVQAHKWFNLAAQRGNPEARRYRQEIAVDMSKAEIARAQKLAREWLAVH